MIDLLIDSKLITDHLELDSEKVKQFLEADRGFAMGQLARSWKASRKINELKLIDTLIFDDQVKSNPPLSRAFLLDLIQNLPENTWFNIQEFCNWIYQNQPDVLRSGGDYDAWFIKNSATGGFIKGFGNWQQVEGEYIRTMIQMPLFWLGFVDMGKIPGDSSPTVFRKSKWFNALMADHELKYPFIKVNNFEIEKSGRININRFFPRDIRYQMARCCEWESVRGQNFYYHISPNSFARMEQQGLKVSQLISLITRYARKPIPQNILVALERWEKNAQEAAIEKIMVIRVKSASIMDRLMDSSAKKYIVSRLDPTTAEISADSALFIKAALIEMGIFAEI